MHERASESPILLRSYFTAPFFWLIDETLNRMNIDTYNTYKYSMYKCILLERRIIFSCECHKRQSGSKLSGLLISL